MIPSVIIASYAKSDKHKRMTDNAIKTAHLAGISDVIVVETMQNVEYYNAKTIHYPKTEKFCYNKALNLGIALAKNKYIALCNNDLVFDKSFGQIGKIMFMNGIRSASPMCPRSHRNGFTKGNFVYYGYRIGFELCGWCIVIDRDILPEIGGKLDETYLFWFSDNAYADQLNKAGIKHGLLCNIIVTHLGSQTLNTLSKGQTLEYTFEQEQKYRNAEKKSIVKQPRKSGIK